MRVADARVKVRYRSEAVAATVTETADGFALDLAEPVFGVARGQFAVLYDDDAVVGAGVDHGRRLNRASRIAAREPPRDIGR